MKKADEILDEQIQRIKESCSRGDTLKSISLKEGLSAWHIRRIVDPDGYEKARKRARQRDRYRGQGGKKFETIHHNPLYDPRRDGVLYHDSFTSLLLGDPLPGRSALDDRRKEVHQEKEEISLGGRKGSYRYASIKSFG